MRRLFFPIALLVVAAAFAQAKVMVVFRLASPPLPVETGQRFSLCAANVGVVNADLTLQFINVRTGAIVASRNMVLPPPGAAAMPDPCLETTADALMAAGPPQPGGQPPLLVALVVIRHGLFSRASAATASVQVTAAQPNGPPRLVASVPLLVANLTNGRNTPLERIH